MWFVCWLAGWLTWRRRRGHSATASLQLCARAVPCPPASCLSCGSSAASLSLSPVSLSSALCVLCHFVPSCPVEILTIALLYCRTATVLTYTTPPPPLPPQTRPSVCLPFVSQCPRDFPPEPLARSFARCRPIPAGAYSTVASCPRRRPTACSQLCITRPSVFTSSRLHARPRRYHLRYHHHYSQGLGITPDTTRP